MRTDLTNAVKTLTVGLLILASTVCAASSGGFWIPFTATPIAGTTGGKTGLFLISSNALESSPGAHFVSTTPSQLLGIALQDTLSAGVLTYTPALMMYAAAGSDGNTHVYGLTLSGTATVPVPVQISNLSLPATEQICGSNQAESDLATPTSLFVVLEIAATGKCGLGGGTFEVVFYTDSATMAPNVVSISSNQFDAIYQDGELEGIMLFDPATGTLNLYEDLGFVDPTPLLTGIKEIIPIVTATINTGTKFGNNEIFFSAIGASSTAEYRIVRSPDTGYAASKFHTGVVGSSTVDDKNLYFADVTSSTTTKIYQEPFTGGTPKLLYSGPSTGVAYQLFGTNDSVLAFQVYALSSVTDATGTLYTVPIGVTSTTATKIMTYNGILSAFLASPTAGDVAGNILFANVMMVIPSGTTTSTHYTAFAIPPSDPSKQTQVANAVYEPFGILSSELTGAVWEVDGITDINGGWGGGTVSQVDVSTLASTAFKTKGGGAYVVPANYLGGLTGFSNNNFGVGTFLHEQAFEFPKAATFGVAVDLSEDYLLPIKFANTNVSAF